MAAESAPEAAAPREATSLRRRLWPHRPVALDSLEAAGDAGRTRGGPADFEVVVDDEAYYVRTVKVSHLPGKPPANLFAVAAALVEAPADGPLGWDPVSSECRENYGVGLRAEQGGTTVSLTAKIVVCRGVTVDAEDADRARAAALQGLDFDWPAETEGWRFYARRGPQAVDVDPIAIEAEREPEPDVEAPRPGM